MPVNINPWLFSQNNNPAIFAGETYPSVLDDGNTVAWFDSAENITKDGSDFVSVWGDKSGLSHNLLQATGTNQPLWTADGVLFDGVDNSMKCAAFTLIQPEFIYIVFKQVTWTINDRFFDGNTDTSGIVKQRILTPNIHASAGTSSAPTTALAVNTFGIVRVLFNGVSSKLIVNESTPVTGDFGPGNMGGFILGDRVAVGSYGHIQVKEIIIRKVADTSESEAEIYAYLADKYSI